MKINTKRKEKKSTICKLTKVKKNIFQLSNKSFPFSLVNLVCNGTISS